MFELNVDVIFEVLEVFRSNKGNSIVYFFDFLYDQENEDLYLDM